VNALAGWLPSGQDGETVNESSHRVVLCTHDALVTDRTAAEASTQAIRDVVQFGSRRLLRNRRKGVSVPYVIGIVLSAGVAVFARYVGFDRDRAFYPTVMIVIASYYVLFAAMSGSVQTVVIESVVMMLFAAAAVAGFKSSAWIVVVALAGHGVFDAVHGQVIENAGVPAWWPAWCLSYDVGAAAGLAWLLRRGLVANGVRP
jgi:hypothetical protein